MGRTLGIVCFALAWMAIPAGAQRRPVLPQIDEPHPYYFRELYVPQLTAGPSSVSWAPDSQELVYSMAGSLWRQRLDSKEAVQLTDGPGYDYQPDWSPDGKSVVYVSYQKDAMELWLLDLATKKTKQLTKGAAVNVEPRWSPDGKKIAWVSTQYNKRFHVFLADSADGELKNVTRLTGETKSSLPRYYYSAYDLEINPVWTRDGKDILFVSNSGHIYGTGGFWRMKAEPGTEAHEIHYEESGWKARPDFSPDGSRIVYSSYLGRQWHNLWVMPAKGGDAFPISYGSWDQTNPRWSPDGRKIAYVSNFTGSTAIEVQEFPTGQIEQVTGFESKNLKFLKPVGTVRVFVETEDGQMTSARVSLTDEIARFCWQDSATVHADDGFDRSEMPLERHYVYVNGSDNFVASAGRVTLEVSKGPGYQLNKRTLEIGAGETKIVRVRLQPLQSPWKPADHWSSADLHVHMNYGGAYQNDLGWLHFIADGEGVQFVNNLAVNKEQRFPDIEYVDFEENFGDETSSRIVQGQEFHTSYWGHRGILNLKDHLLLPGYAGYPNTAAASLYPMNADVYDMAHLQGALVGAVHPFDEVPDPFAHPAQQITDELPVDVALGKLDYMEIVGFSDHKSTAAVWYKLLNLGFRIPAGGGTDATTNYAAPIRGQVGFDRVYVWTSGWPVRLETWLDELKQGRTFATNGPLIEFKLGGEMVGSELKFDAAQAAVPFTAKLRSFVPVDHLEVVCNGKIAQTLQLDGTRDSADTSGTIPLSQSGWCVLRAWSEKPEYPVMDNYAYATTSPVYVTIGGKRAYAKEDSDYFKAWIDRTIEITERYPDWNSSEEKQGVMKTLRDARAIYEGMK
ncbi:MAG TPA: CehA/McbA family metallohydrolase [Candidatus Acidoferrum sp.]|nr:CehA/McbA family metallohydrolase [Candidatus Acidoferrum sp.]